MQILDVALTYAAVTLLLGSTLYFAIVFASFVWSAESGKVDHAKIATLTAHIQAVEKEIQQTETDLELIGRITPLMQQEKTELKLETGELEAAVAETVKVVEPLHLGSTARIAYRSAASHLLTQAAIVIPNIEIMINANGKRNEIALAENNESCQATPRIERRTLKIWKRRGEQVVPVPCLSVPIPEHIQRLQWRGVAVIRLDDLSEIAEIV